MGSVSSVPQNASDCFDFYATSASQKNVCANSCALSLHYGLEPDDDLDLGWAAHYCRFVSSREVEQIAEYSRCVRSRHAELDSALLVPQPEESAVDRRYFQGIRALRLSDPTQRGCPQISRAVSAVIQQKRHLLSSWLICEVTKRSKLSSG
jgi:hypothetical protein